MPPSSWRFPKCGKWNSCDVDLVLKLEALHEQAAADHSQHHVAACCREAIKEIKTLRLNADGLALSLADALSTYRPDGKPAIITRERLGAWHAALEQYKQDRRPT